MGLMPIAVKPHDHGAFRILTLGGVVIHAESSHLPYKQGYAVTSRVRAGSEVWVRVRVQVKVRVRVRVSDLHLPLIHGNLLETPPLFVLKLNVGTSSKQILD